MFVDTNDDDDDDDDDHHQTSADRFCPALLRNFRSPSFPSPRISGVSPKTRTCQICQIKKKNSQELGKYRNFLKGISRFYT